MWRVQFYLSLLFVTISITFCQILPTDKLDELLDVNGRFRLTDAANCLRTCYPNEAPKVCYYRFTVENFMSNAVGCNSCTPNASTLLTDNCQCVLGDGFERSCYTVNRHIPGSSIQVCKNDLVVIDVSNKLQAQDLTIHWHGIYQRGTQYYDGVPYVTQCPIMEGHTFRYQWVAEQAGTHFYHSHSGIQEMNGIYGSIIVREPVQEDVHNSLYDTDYYNHVIVVSEWMHELTEERFPGRRVNETGQTPAAFLINGRGLPNDGRVGSGIMEQFLVESGKRHRFRLVNAFSSVCPCALTIEGHRLKVIASDGNPVRPLIVDTIVSFTGERYDFILEAKQTPGIYWIQLKGLGECAELQIVQVAQIIYNTNNWKPRFDRPTFRRLLPHKVTLNPFDNPCNVNSQTFICVDALRSAKPVKKEILKAKPDYKIFLSFLFRNITASEMFRNKTYDTYLVAPNGDYVQSLINGISFVPPASPMLSQYSDVKDNSFICNFADRKRCADGCTCVHLLEFPLNSVIEMIILDEAQIPTLSHPFHLHGQEFFVMAMQVPPQNPDGTLNVPYTIDMEKHGKLSRNFDNPPAKDTVAVPRSGIMIIRFQATNPGFWLLHCHFNYHMVIGMDLVVRAGTEKDLPPIPQGFPKCGDYTPPIFPHVQSLEELRPQKYAKRG